MRTFWQPVFLARELAPGHTVSLRIMGEDLVLARDASGRPRAGSYPTEEYLGLVFAFLGGGEPPPLPRYPDFETDGVFETGSYVRDCNFFNNVENQVDPVHVA